jgi:hypothetical protein
MFSPAMFSPAIADPALARFFRKRRRIMKRRAKASTFHAAGLNGVRAIARRRRQIAAGQLTAANGLVA